MKTQNSVLITGANGFIGKTLMKRILLTKDCIVKVLVRNKKIFLSNIEISPELIKNLKIFEGSLRNPSDIINAVSNVDIIYHCAAKKSGHIASMYYDTVISTYNLLNAVLKYNASLKRFVHLSSFSVYKTADLPKNSILTEKTKLENNFKSRTDSYSYIKVKQEEVVYKYMRQYDIPIVILRPGVVYGPGGENISRRVGFNLFGLFLNIGGKNLLPLSYIDNCIDAILLASDIRGIDYEIFNVIDTQLINCNDFLELYCNYVQKLRIIRIPYKLFLILSYLFEKYVQISKEQIPSVFSVYSTASLWKPMLYNNNKLVEKLGFNQKIRTSKGLHNHFKSCKALR